MKRLLLGVAAAAVFAAFTPANAQVYLGAGPEGAGVQVGPLGVGVGPAWHEDYAYLPDCRIVRERFVTPRGHVIWRSHRECD
jgi:hypothetical protein